MGSLSGFRIACGRPEQHPAARAAPTRISPNCSIKHCEYLITYTVLLFHASYLIRFETLGAFCKIYCGLQEGQDVGGSKPTLGSSLRERLSQSKTCAAGSISQSRASEEVLSRVERYRFLDLLPVGEDELSVMLSSKSPLSAGAAASSVSAAPCVRPRFVHWEPFKPLRPLEDCGSHIRASIYVQLYKQFSQATFSICTY